MTENEVHSMVMSRVKDNNPKAFRTYFIERDPDKRKKVARRFLKQRIQEEPDFRFLLPESLMKKVKIQRCTEALISEQEQQLIDQVKGKLEGVIK